MTEASANGADSEGSAPTRRLSLALMVSLVALLSSAVSLVFVLWPGLRPDPRSNREAEVSVFAVERGVRYDDFLRRAQRVRDPGIAPNLRGQLVYAEARVRGFKRRTVRLRWSAYHADTRTRYDAPALEDIGDSERTLETPTDRFVQPIWVPPVYCADRRYFVRVELVDDDGFILAVADSEAFSGLRPRRELRSICAQPG